MNLKEQINLITRVHQLIRLKATGTPEQFVQRLDMSKRNLFRLIDDMKTWGFPIVYDKQKGTYCYEQEVTFTFKINVAENFDAQTIKGGENFLSISENFSQSSRFWHWATPLL